MKKKSGFLVAFEGIDGSGKSTLSRLVFNELTALSIPTVLTKEPGGTKIGQKIRAIVHEHVLTPQAEFLLFAADRSEHITGVIIPALDDGKIVLSDRMADSSRAYQGYGRGIDLKLIDGVTQWVMQGIKPDLIIYCKIDAATAFNRIVQRKEELTVFEREKTQFFERVIQGFEKIFDSQSAVLVVDATQSPQALCTQVIAELRRRLENVA
jgi:dTMP kinase